MKNSKVVIDESENRIEVEILLGFKIEEINKEYIVYTINDDEISDTVTILISQIEYTDEIPKIISIPESEKEMVLLFYNNIKESL